MLCKLEYGKLLCGLFLVGSGCTVDRAADLQSRLEGRAGESGAEVVGIYFRDSVRGDSIMLDVDSRVHAASMMKVPVMIQLFRDAEVGMLSLDDSVTIKNTFRSIVDGSPYELSAPEDSEGTLYARLGERESIRQLTELMITISSNLATNILIELVGAERVQGTMRELGADSIEVLRGVEDGKAYRAGLSNSITARDMGIIFDAINEHRAASEKSCHEMIEIMSRQQFNEGIPARLPAGARVAHKTGSITEIRHDGGIVYTEDGATFVLVVLTRGIEDRSVADELIADIAEMVYAEVARPAE
jgi:beta-lactamase class A